MRKFDAEMHIQRVKSPLEDVGLPFTPPKSKEISKTFQFLVFFTL
jgi:hypothetical protein